MSDQDVLNKVKLKLNWALTCPWAERYPSITAHSYPQQFSTSALRLRLDYWESWAKILHQDYTCCIPPWHKFFLWITGNLEPQKLSPWNKKSKRPNCTEKEGLHCPSLNCCQSDVHSGTLCLTSLLCRIVGQANLMKSYFHKNINHY